MKIRLVPLVAAIAAAGLLITACTQAAPPPTPTKAPAAPAPTKAAEPTKPAAATAAPTKAPEPTKAPAAPTAAPAKKIDYPQKGRSIGLIVPFPPGGSADVGARLLAAALEKELGTPVQVESKPGAGSQVGIQELVSSRPDGYTIGATLLPSTNTLYLDPERKAAFGPRSFQPMAGFTVAPNVLSVKADGPFKTLKDVVDAAKANPAGVKAGVSGPMGIVHLMALQLSQLAGIKFGFVHFDGGNQAITALLGGHVDIAFSATTEALPHVKSGATRVLGIGDVEESKSFPGVKTMAAEGYKVTMVTTHAYSAPAGTPMEIVNLLSAATKKVLADATMQQKLGDVALQPRYLDPAQLGALWNQLDVDVKPLMDLAKATASK